MKTLKDMSFKGSNSNEYILTHEFKQSLIGDYMALKGVLGDIGLQQYNIDKKTIVALKALGAQEYIKSKGNIKSEDIW